MPTPRSSLFFPLLFCLLLLGGPAEAAGASIANASAQQKKEATESYTNGMAKFQNKNFGSAMADFEQSYGAVKSPNTLLMVARSLIELGQLSEGYRRLLQAEQEAAEAKKTAAKYEATETAAREERLELGKKLGFLKISVPAAKPGDKVLLEGRELEAVEWEESVPVMPGAVEVTLASGNDRFTQHVDVKAGGTVVLSVEVPAPVEAPVAAPATPAFHVEVKATPSTSKVPLYVSGGVGLAGLATFAIFGTSSRSKYSDLDAACPSKMNCPAGLKSSRDDGRRAQAIANVGLMVGLFGATSAAFFYLSGEEQKPEVHTAGVPRVDVGLGSVSFRGSF